LTVPLAFSFTTGSFSITSPSGSEVIENSTLVLEARASDALGTASVVFTVNGQAQPAVSGPPFTRSFIVGSASAVPSLTIVASARNAAGAEIATDQRTVSVVVGLGVTPTLIGVPLDGTGVLRFSVSSALASDLPISLSAGDPAIVSVPTSPVVIPAGQTSVTAVIGGSATGATAVNATSPHGLASAIVAVSAPALGQTLTPFGTSIGLSLSNPAAAGFVAAPAGSSRTVRVTLNSPATAGATVSVFTTNAAVATVSAGPLSADGLTIDLNISTLADGIASIVVRVGNEARAFTVFVGTPPPGSTPLLVASPAGLSISNPPNAGQVIATAGRTITLSIPLLSTPAAADTPVVVTTSNGGVVSVVSAVVRAGQTAAAITITTVADGVATLTLRAGAEIRAVTVFVGTPPSGSTPILLAQPIGISVAALPTLGRTFAPLGAVRTLGVRLFDTPVAVDTPVTVTTSDPSVAIVNGTVVVRAGQQIASLEIATGAAGTATLTIEAAGSRRELTLVVGSDPTPGTTPPIVAAPVGVTVIPNASIGRVLGRPGTVTVATLGVPLLQAAAGTATVVTVTSSNTNVATLGGAASTTSTIPIGSQSVDLPISLSGTEGAALLTFEFGGVRRELLIVVGNPPASDIPALSAPVVGVRIGQ
jgi:hypothetical protein